MKQLKEIDPLKLIKTGNIAQYKERCSTCRDVGYIKEGERHKRCFRCLPEKVRDKVSSLCGEKYRECSFSNFDWIYGSKKSLNSPSTKIKIPYDIGFDQSYLFYGPAGCGKTHLSIALFKKDLLDGKNAIWVTELQLLRDAQNYLYNYKDTTKSESLVNTIFDNPKDLDAVYCDDVGKMNLTDNRRVIIYEFIEALCKNNVKLVMTTNVIDFREWLGEEISKAVWSRVVGMCHIVKFNANKDRRIET